MVKRWERITRKLDKRIAEREEEKRLQSERDLLERREREGGEALKLIQLAAEEMLDAIEDQREGRITEDELFAANDKWKDLHARWLAGELPEQQKGEHDDG